MLGYIPENHNIEWYKIEQWHSPPKKYNTQADNINPIHINIKFLKSINPSLGDIH